MNDWHIEPVRLTLWRPQHSCRQFGTCKLHDSTTFETSFEISEIYIHVKLYPTLRKCKCTLLIWRPHGLNSAWLPTDAHLSGSVTAIYLPVNSWIRTVARLQYKQVWINRVMSVRVRIGCGRAFDCYSIKSEVRNTEGLNTEVLLYWMTTSHQVLHQKVNIRTISLG